MASLLYAATSNAFNTTLNGNVGTSDTTITLTSTTGLQSPGLLVIDRVNANGTATPLVREYISFTGISSNTLTGVARNLGGSSAQTHSSGAIVEDCIDVTRWNNVITALLNAFTSGGVVDTTKIVDLTSSQTLTNKILTSPILNTGVSGTAIDTDGTLAANSDTVIASQKAVKTYVTSSGSTDGWITSADTWVYASASTFTIAGVDRTAVYTKGTRIKFTQSATVKYGVVASSAFSTNTTVTIIVNTDYVLANAVISANSYSYQANPQGYPGSFTFAPAATGLTGITYDFAKFSVIGNRITVDLHFSGTSNSTELSATAPISISTGTGATIGYHCLTANNGSFASAAVLLGNSSGSTFNFTTAPNYAGGANANNFTASGQKGAQAQVIYDF